MRFIFSCENPIIVHNMRNLLTNAGIKTQLRNEFSSSAVGDLAPLNTWCELYVFHDKDYQKAKHLIAEFELQTSTEIVWVCKSCESTNPDNFEFCWSCQKEC